MVEAQQIADALRAAGAEELPPGPKAWLVGRVARYGWDEERHNLGGLLPAEIGKAKKKKKKKAKTYTAAEVQAAKKRQYELDKARAEKQRAAYEQQLAAYQQQAQQAQMQQGYPPPGYPPPGYPPGYPPPGYDPSQMAPGYPPPGYPPPGYDPSQMAAPGYPPPGYPSPGYDPSQMAPGYPPPGYDPSQMAAPGYPPGYPPPGYDPSQMAAPGYPPGYPPPGYDPSQMGVDPSSMGYEVDGSAEVGSAPARPLERFADLAGAADALVEVARRAGARYPSEAPSAIVLPPAVLAVAGLGPDAPVDDQRLAFVGHPTHGRWHLDCHQDEHGTACGAIGCCLGVGWVPGFGPSDEAQKVFRQLRGDWEAFEREGVGTSILPHLKRHLVDWRAFRDAWEAGTVPTNDIANQLNAMVGMTNAVRSELVEKKTGKPTAPGDLPADQKRRGVDLDKEHGFASSVDAWVRQMPVLSYLTDPRQTPAQAGRRILGVAAAAVGIAIIIGMAIGRRPGAPVVVVSGGAR